ncbi:MAG: PqqD family protein [Fluviicola sp.]|nr:PqqD family protein [Fluviicola sp.]
MHINKNIAISETGFVFNPLSGDSFSTNQVGQAILRILQLGISQGEIVSQLVDEFSVDRQTVEKDLTDFLLMLRNYQILMDDDKA